MALYNSSMNQASSSGGGQNPLLVKLNYPPGLFNLCTEVNMILCDLIFVEAEGDPEKYRFQVELEFVQCLANPNYLNCK